MLHRLIPHSGFEQHLWTLVNPCRVPFYDTSNSISCTPEPVLLFQPQHRLGPSYGYDGVTKTPDIAASMFNGYDVYKVIICHAKFGFCPVGMALYISFAAWNLQLVLAQTPQECTASPARDLQQVDKKNVLFAPDTGQPRKQSHNSIKCVLNTLILQLVFLRA